MHHATARLLGSLESGTSGGDDHRGGVGGGRGGKKTTGMVNKMTKQLPDGVVAVVKGLMDDDNPEVKRRVAAVTRALQQPAKLVGAAGKRADGLGVGTVLVFTLAATQMFLEIASRKYAEDFSGFHDHEHWPGYCLVLLRLMLAGLFTVGGRTALQAGPPPSSVHASRFFFAQFKASL